MRILGLDPGSKRVGMALSDELGMIAQPLDYLPAEPFEEFIRQLLQLIETRGVEMILVGMPRNMDGSYGPAADRSRALIERLRERTDLPVRPWDERLTTAQANRVLIAGNVSRQKRKEKVDKMAAAILLQSFLDARSA
jgi:putative Holliday junction resolvase